ncbi:MAG: sigma-54 dependent transcriptional regulator, partial [Bacteroidetes bacterium]|nr:sigma-54 dependent transcriptional regulator [Bacteroidota bacterium]
MPHRILVVDDERAIRNALREILEHEGYRVEEAASAEEALEQALRSEVDLVLLDVKMPGRDGLEVLEALRQGRPELPVVLLTGHGTIELAVEAIRRGAFDFLEKPPDLNRLLVTLRNALRSARLEAENRALRRRLERLDPILGQSPAIEEVRAILERVAPTEARVLILGESGTGKELVARWIHARSRRGEGPFVALNCAAIPAELLEAELFGHEKGAFTGAIKDRPGLFELASSGTLFLDEIGDMPLQAQAKVLRALEERHVQRIGGRRPIPVDVRILAATNKDLAALVRAGAFREDLYHRLAVITLRLPPLRERPEDVPLLAQARLERVCAENGFPPKRFSQAALRALQALPWPGNVRELYNAVERLAILATGPEITADDVRRHVSGADSGSALPWEEARTWAEFRARAERYFLERELARHGWNVLRTAEAIGMPRSHLYA